MDTPGSETHDMRSLGMRLREVAELLALSAEVSTEDAAQACGFRSASGLRSLGNRHPELLTEPYSARVGKERVWRVGPLLQWLARRAP